VKFGNQETATMAITNNHLRTKESYQIDQDIKAFLRKGGKVKKIANGVFGQTDYAHGSSGKANKPGKKTK